MAISASIHWGYILRPFVEQEISQEGWRFLLTEIISAHNFDGEIIGLGFHKEKMLRNFGFRGSEAGLEADFIDANTDFMTAANSVNWLQRVPVIPLVDDIKPFDAWKLKASDVFTVSEGFGGRVLTKGYDVDWPPYIGRIR